MYMYIYNIYIFEFVFLHWKKEDKVVKAFSFNILGYDCCEG